MLQSIFITKPDDWHVHFRDNEMLPKTVNATAKHFARALVMPNLQPPLTTINTITSYRTRIEAILKNNKFISFTPYMTIYINENLSIDELYKAKKHDFILGCKLYPLGATTNSESGVKTIKKLYPIFEVMQDLDLALQIHGEVTHSDIFIREELFINEELIEIIKNFPKLRIVLEHISTKFAAEFVSNASSYVAATITPHHLFYNRNHLLVSGIKPHYYCLPILKKEEDQVSLQKAAVSGNSHFFAGTDSAPHLKQNKENACGCAGIFSAPYATAMYTEIFDNHNKLDKLEPFMSHFGADFYNLPRNTTKIELIKKSQKIPDLLNFDCGQIVPIGAGTTLKWSINE